MKKKLIFFDGDGTLWYPKATKRTKKPHWVYHDPATKDDFLSHLELTPGTKETLEWLKQKDLRLVVISANPSEEKTAMQEMKERLEYFELIDLIDSYRVSRGDDPTGKSAIMLEIIGELDVERVDALMVGDSYVYDYLAAQNVGIDALFIKSEVANLPRDLPDDFRSIDEIDDLRGLLR